MQLSPLNVIMAWFISNILLRQAEYQENAHAFLSDKARGFPYIIISLLGNLLSGARCPTLIVIINLS